MNAVLHVISDSIRHRQPLLESLVLAAQGGADVIQIRDKKASAAETYDLVLKLQQALATRDNRPNLFVNNHIDVAIATNLSGVHLGVKALPLEAVRRLRLQANWPGQIGCSVHSLKEAAAAEQAGADYVTFGHIYPSQSHPGAAPRGLHALREVVNALSIPVVAIGGINSANLQSVLETGCSGVAVIGAILNADNPLKAAQALKQGIEESEVRLKIPMVKRSDIP